MKLKMIRNRSWPGPTQGTVLWEVEEIPGLLVLNCQRHKHLGYYNGQFQDKGWMVAARGNLPEEHLAKQLAAQLQSEVFVNRSEAVQAIAQAREDYLAAQG